MQTRQSSSSQRRDRRQRLQYGEAVVVHGGILGLLVGGRNRTPSAWFVEDVGKRIAPQLASSYPSIANCRTDFPE
jgi:hypothetical protein